MKCMAFRHSRKAKVVFFTSPSSSNPLSLKKKYCSFVNGTHLLILTDVKISIISIITSGFIHYIQKHIVHERRRTG